MANEERCERKREKIRERIEELAEEFCRLLYGGDGSPEWGTKFTAIEDAGVEIGDALACRLMEKALAIQVRNASSQAEVCSCGQELEEKEQEPHVMTTRRGDVAWTEPAGHCNRCRRDFFPSGASLGDRTGEQL